jgi:dienelactone hydrolase/Fe-S cluster assembly iron-binding protein IscA
VTTGHSIDQVGQDPERKGFITLIPAAAEEIRTVMQQRSARYLRISVSADYEYRFGLDNDVNPEQDQLGESQGITVVVDRRSALQLPPGLTLTLGRTGFIFYVSGEDAPPPDTSVSLAEARRGFETTLLRRESDGNPAPEPPPDVFHLVQFDAPVGKLAAYLTPDPGDGRQHPAIIWITGGDCNTIGDVWSDRPAENEQSASAYRKAGIVMMFPSLRGGNDNPGVREGFFGEVEDVLAAAEFLAQQPYVDARRIHLGGHSSGGTLAVLTAECSDRFRAVFSFGPVDDLARYGPKLCPFVMSDAQELALRAPARWLHSIRTPLFVFEGTGGDLYALQVMTGASQNPKVHFFEVQGADHFDVLAPTNQLIAEKILRDTEPMSNLILSADEVNEAFATTRP